MRDMTDRTTRVTAYEDGPFLVRGAFKVVDRDGNEVATSRRTIALCRCGRSSIKPFCDGTHVRIAFKAPGETPRNEP